MNLGRMIRQKDRKSQMPVCGRNEHTEFSAWEKALRFVQNRKREHGIKLRRAARWGSCHLFIFVMNVLYKYLRRSFESLGYKSLDICSNMYNKLEGENKEVPTVIQKIL